MYYFNAHAFWRGKRGISRSVLLVGKWASTTSLSLARVQITGGQIRARGVFCLLSLFPGVTYLIASLMQSTPHTSWEVKVVESMKFVWFILGKTFILGITFIRGPLTLTLQTVQMILVSYCPSLTMRSTVMKRKATWAFFPSHSSQSVVPD